MGRLLPPASNDQTLTTHTKNTNNTDVVINDNNNVATYSLDLVLPINTPQEQVDFYTGLRINGTKHIFHKKFLIMLYNDHN